MVLSARTRNDSGILSPRAFAVFEVDDQLKRSRLFDRDVGDLDASEELNDLSSKVSKELIEARSIGAEPTFLRQFGRLIDGR